MLDAQDIDLKTIFSRAALLCVDTQRGFCDPEIDNPRGNKHTKEVCQSLTVEIPKYRNAGVPIIWLYMNDRILRPANPDKSYGGFYLAYPDVDRDAIIPKKGDSGFVADETIGARMLYKVRRKHPALKLEKHLQKEDINTLLVTGVNLSACVKETARLAVLRGYNVILLYDLVANDNENPANSLAVIKSVADRLKAPALRDEWGAANKADIKRGQVYVMSSQDALTQASKYSFL
jgi:nicotinamidase-related amidase